MSIRTSLAAKKPKRARGHARVASLLDAGAALFAQKGYTTTTMTEIAAQADASIGSLYQFFPSKEALAEALFSRYAERTATALEPLVAQAHSLTVVQLADHLIDLMLGLRADRDAAIALSGAVAGIAERRKPLREVMRSQLKAVLCSANPQLTAKESTLAAMMVAHLMKIVPAVAAEARGNRKSIVAELRKLMVYYLSQVIEPR